MNPFIYSIFLKRKAKFITTKKKWNWKLGNSLTKQP